MRPARPQTRPPVRVTWWDRLLMGIAPSWGLRRLHARYAASGYEAASGGRRTDGWRRGSTDANAANAPALPALRELARDLVRNNGWARRAVRVIANNTVGWGIEPRAKDVDARIAEAAVAAWQTWADSVDCDFDGRMSFYGLQRLVMLTVVVSGEALVVRQPGDDYTIPLRVQVLEPDYLDVNKFNDGPGNRIVQGIEIDADGRRVAYHLFTAHPGAMTMTTGRAGFSIESKRVPAENVIHVFDVERPGQMRGVPWYANAISRLNDFDDFEDAQLMQQKIAACFAAFVQDFDGTASPLGEQSTTDETIESLEPGHVSYLPPGKTVAFAQPPPVTDASFTTRNLRRVAAGLGVTYEELTFDFSQVNFSSARMARLAHWANVHDWRWNMLIPQFCDGVWRWAMELAAALEGWPAIPRAEWSPPPMPMLEPDKEGLAYQRLLRIGAMTWPQMVRELGYDPATQLAEIAEWNDYYDAVEVILDSDPRMTNTSGGPRMTAAPTKDGEQPTEGEPADDGPADEEPVAEPLPAADPEARSAALALSRAQTAVAAANAELARAQARAADAMAISTIANDLGADVDEQTIRDRFGVLKPNGHGALRGTKPLAAQALADARRR